MPKQTIPFIGGAYEHKSKNIAAEVCVNLYPEIEQEGKYREALIGVPGLKPWWNIEDSGLPGPVRGMIGAEDYLYVVGSTGIVRLREDLSPDIIVAVDANFPLDQDDRSVWVAFGGQYIGITDAYGKTWRIDTTVVAPKYTLVANDDSDIPLATSLTWQDGYFIVTKLGTGDFYISALDDITDWDATDLANAESDPYDLVAAYSVRRQLALFGRNNTEIWYNSGASDFPFDPITGAIIPNGCSAPHSIAEADGSLIWLDNFRRVVQTEGYYARTISTIPLNQELQSYGDVSDAIGFSYSQDGHTFYQITFPSARKTWVYDLTTGLWHQRASFPELPHGEFNRHRANCYVYFNGKHLVGDYETGQIYELDPNTYDDNSGQNIIATRRAEAVHDTRVNLFHHEFELEFEAGTGLVETQQGDDPQAMLRWSDDGGHSWSNEIWRDIGKIGKYKSRARWQRLGVSRERIYEVRISDPIKRVILAAHLEASAGAY
jgi:hypothetical protein